jgi:hypothetical protein
LVRAAYRLLPRKADWDPHRIKFPIAAWENWHWVSPAWRPHMLAVASCFFIGADALDTDLAKQIREGCGRSNYVTLSALPHRRCMGAPGGSGRVGPPVRGKATDD